MSKKNVGGFCYDCDLSFTIKYDKDETKINPSFCPFCGEGIEMDVDDEDNDGDSSDDRNSEDEDDNIPW